MLCVIRLLMSIEFQIHLSVYLLLTDILERLGAVSNTHDSLYISVVEYIFGFFSLFGFHLPNFSVFDLLFPTNRYLK